MKKTIYSLLIIISALIITNILVNSIITNPVKDKLTVTGHRGAAYYEPENTIQSVKKAIELGVARVEIDIQRTADSVLIVLHDQDIDRTTNGTGKAIDLSFSKIQEYDIIDSELKLKIPTLEQVIKEINGQTKLLIEIKEGNDFYPSIEKQVIDMIDKHNANNWCIIQSFKDDVLSEIRKYDKKIEVHKLCYGKIPLIPYIFSPKISSLNKPLYNSISEFSCMHKFANNQFVKTIHKKGKKVNVWTVDEKSVLDKMIKIGVDGVITNNPKLYLK